MNGRAKRKDHHQLYKKIRKKYRNIEKKTEKELNMEENIALEIEEKYP